MRFTLRTLCNLSSVGLVLVSTMVVAGDGKPRLLDKMIRPGTRINTWEINCKTERTANNKTTTDWLLRRGMRDGNAHMWVSASSSWSGLLALCPVGDGPSIGSGQRLPSSKNEYCHPGGWKGGSIHRFPIWIWPKDAEFRGRVTRNGHRYYLFTKEEGPTKVRNYYLRSPGDPAFMEYTWVERGSSMQETTTFQKWETVGGVKMYREATITEVGTLIGKPHNVTTKVSCTDIRVNHSLTAGHFTESAAKLEATKVGAPLPHIPK